MALEPTELFPEVPNLYEFPSVHSDMIYDQQRVHAYQRAIERTVKPGDVVVDVGTGTGLLAFLCVRAGARHVHAIDRSPIIHTARRLAEANSLSDRITFHYGNSTDIELDDTADVIVSELIGHIAFEEGMAEAIFDAKRRFLKPTGAIIPESVRLIAAPVCDESVYPSVIDSWVPAYGLDFSIMREQALANSYITEINESDLLARQETVLSVSFDEEVPQLLEGQCRFVIHRKSQVNGVALWFDAQLAEDVILSSSPWAKTHWMQCFTPVPNPIDVFPKDVISLLVKLELNHSQGNRFKLGINITKEASNGTP